MEKWRKFKKWQKGLIISLLLITFVPYYVGKNATENNENNTFGEIKNNNENIEQDKKYNLQEENKEDTTSETISQKYAIRKAKEYLRFMAFSKNGLIDQLEYEKFSNADATYAVENIIVNWNDQAKKKAIEYLDTTAFSRDGLIDQLLYEKFTNEQSIYGTDNSGANWNEQAILKARQYLDMMSFSRESLIDQLLYEKFTREQAEYGVNSTGL